VRRLVRVHDHVHDVFRSMLPSLSLMQISILMMRLIMLKSII
jgi:hypothetical protein